MGRIITVRDLLPPEPNLVARVQPQYLHWQVGRYLDRLSFGPGGRGRGRIWVPEVEGEQHNLILTQTYDTLIGQYGLVDLGNYAVVGTGSAAPDPNQTGLVGEVARTNLNPGGSGDAEPTAGQFVLTRVREFTEAQVGGRNLTEWGFSPVSSAGNNLMCRELFRDGSGNPVVLTLASDQRLRLIYKYAINYSPAVGVGQAISVNINGLGTRSGQFFISRFDQNYFGGLGHLYMLSDWAAGKVSAGGGVWGIFTSVVNVSTTPSANAPGGSATDIPAYSGNSVQNVSAIGTTLITRGRKINSRTFLNTEANITWYGVKVLRIHDASGTKVGGQAIIAFNAGQEFTKDNEHKMLVGEWVLTWGP